MTEFWNWSRMNGIETTPSPSNTATILCSRPGLDKRIAKSPLPVAIRVSNKRTVPSFVPKAVTPGESNPRDVSEQNKGKGDAGEAADRPPEWGR